MFMNAIKTAFRSLTRQRSYVLISVLSLTLGITASLLIALFVMRDLQWDSFHANGDRLYRLTNIELSGNATERHSGYSSPAWGPAMAEQIPEIEMQTRVIPFGGMDVQYGDEIIHLSNVLAADSTFLRMFTYPLVYGDTETALTRPNTAIISEKTAINIFGENNPVGKTIRLGENATETEITGVFHQPKQGSHLKFNALVPMYICEEMGFPMDNWYTSFLVTYFTLQPGVSPTSELNQKILELVKENTEAHHQAAFYLQSLKEIHLHSNHISLQMNKGQSSAVMLSSFLAISALILLLACINAINLATTRSLKRAKEVGLRKTIGASKGQLVGQFMGESFILTFVSVLLAVVLVEFAAPWVSEIAGRSLVLDYSNPVFYLMLGVMMVVVSIFSGLYPSFVLSNFRPAIVLKSNPSGRGKSGWVLKTLVCSQFVISTVLVLVLLLVHAQIHYVKNIDLGFASDEIIAVSGEDAIWDKIDQLKAELKQNPAVKSVSASWNVPGHGSRTFNVGEQDSDREWMMEVIPIDSDGQKTFDWEVVKGRFISDEFPSDIAWNSEEGGAVLLNETALADLGWDEAIGKKLTVLGRKGTVIGVLKDFHMASVHEPIKPVIVFNMPNFQNAFVLIRAEANTMSSVVEDLKRTWDNLAGNPVPNYSFLDEQFAQQYESEERIANLLNLFTGLALFIALIGLMGIAMHSTAARAREVSIRKVLGASTSQILRLLTNEFTLLVLLANVIAAPLAWIAMKQWLKSFAFHVPIPWWLFPLAAVGTLSIALITTSLLAIKTANKNPATVLHHE